MSDLQDTIDRVIRFRENYITRLKAELERAERQVDELHAEVERLEHRLRDLLEDDGC